MLVADKMRVQGFHYPFPSLAPCGEIRDRLSGDPGDLESGDLIDALCSRCPASGLFRDCPSGSRIDLKYSRFSGFPQDKSQVQITRPAPVYRRHQYQ
jgi:hypothetical protein